MRGTLRLLLFGALVLLPIIAASAVTFLAIRFFRQDKELYVYDLSAQSVDLAARNLASQLKSLTLKAELNPKSKPFFSVSRPPVDVLPTGRGAFRVDNISRRQAPRLRIFATASSGGAIAIEVPPEALLDLRGYQGPTELMVVNNHGHVLLHRDMDQVTSRANLSELLGRIKIFPRGSSHGARVGTREVEWKGARILVAYARVGSQLAVLQTIGKDQILAAGNPLVTSALVASGIVIIVAILVALILGRLIIRPVRLMAQQAEAIGRGEFGVAVEGQAGGEVAQLMQSFNAMSASLKKREEELHLMQRQLLHAERLNTAGRMITAIVKELSSPLESCFALASQTGHKLPENSPLRVMQKKIMDETNQASNILQNLSRLTSQEESPADAVEPDIVLQDIIVSSKPLFENRNIRVQADLNPVGNVRIGQENLRNALLDIFLFIAGKASSETLIKVALRKVDHTAAIDISFAGPPLSAAQREQLLEPFSAEGAVGGSLELAVAAMVFEEKGGRLLLESNKSGNTLTAELPLA